MREAELALVRVAAALAGGDFDRLDAALAAAAGLAPAAEIEELLVQSYLFLGYPAALNALARWRRLRPEPPAAAKDDAALWTERGERVCARIYGGQYARLRENVAALHPDLERWMVAEGYGKVLGRPGLELRLRELCNIALLVVQPAEPQLHSHMRGALNAGASVHEVESALAAAVEGVPPVRAAAARRVWNEVRARWERGRKEGG